MATGNPQLNLLAATIAIMSGAEIPTDQAIKSKPVRTHTQPKPAKMKIRAPRQSNMRVNQPRK